MPPKSCLGDGSSFRKQSVVWCLISLVFTWMIHSVVRSSCSILYYIVMGTIHMAHIMLIYIIQDNLYKIILICHVIEFMRTNQNLSSNDKNKSTKKFNRKIREFRFYTTITIHNSLRLTQKWKRSRIHGTVTGLWYAHVCKTCEIRPLFSSWWRDIPSKCHFAKLTACTGNNRTYIDYV